MSCYNFSDIRKAYELHMKLVVLPIEMIIIHKSNEIIHSIFDIDFLKAHTMYDFQGGLMLLNKLGFTAHSLHSATK